MGDITIKLGGFELKNKKDQTSFVINAFEGGAKVEDTVDRLTFMYACDVFDDEEIEPLQKVDV